MTGAELKSGAVYAPDAIVNSNVYHPLFTLEIGTPLIWFPPAVSYIVWIVLKMAIDLLLINVFYEKVRGKPYADLALFVLLVSASEYLELAAGQYHFVLNACLLAFLLMYQQQSKLWSTLYYAGSLFVKPIGLLFVPALLFKRQWLLVLGALALFAGGTWLFVLNGSGGYYITNLQKNLFQAKYPGPDQIITLNGLLHHTIVWPALVYQMLQYSILSLVVLIDALKRTHIGKAVFLCVVYFLLFYNLVYEYDWSTLAYVLAFCLVFCEDFQGKFTRFCILLTCLPSCFLVLRLLHIDVTYSDFFGWYAGIVAWRLMVVSKLVPLVLLTGNVLTPDVRLLVEQFRMWFEF